MNYEIRLTPSFQRQLKFVLKKYPLIRSGLDAYLKSMKNQLPGNRIPGHPNLVKDRIALKPYRIGKSGGLRIIYYHAMGASIVFP
jgi:mRNA-degrading endonuclease RelE of RelBE toxin-antitoxin system